MRRRVIRCGRQDFRTAALYRFIRDGKITKNQAKTLALRPMGKHRPADLTRTIETWKFPQRVHNHH